ncbi:uncharacterized protein LOC106153763 [Lingula anatina]|uniref:Uncharacterized protein LOC106153763 n=1 Tax=Lingula anatina TaxID=7574 RepID=A0A1S3HCR2_LINAN|nr:uncharacterized protein LOC106153763 [Lingula anatina]|eukprot:XP_013383316.1 uncharacterized protein LOC106153763 [Lingula anatina]
MKFLLASVLVLSVILLVTARRGPPERFGRRGGKVSRGFGQERGFGGVRGRGRFARPGKESRGSKSPGSGQERGFGRSKPSGRPFPKLFPKLAELCVMIQNANCSDSALPAREICDVNGDVYSNICEFLQAKCKTPNLKAVRCPDPAEDPDDGSGEIPEVAPTETPDETKAPEIAKEP